MAITLATAKHVQAQHAGVTAKSTNPSKSSPESGVKSVPVYSDMGELGGLLFGHTIADSVNRTETGTTAQQTSLGGFVPLAKTKLQKTSATVVGTTAADPGNQTRTQQVQAANNRRANKLAASARRVANNQAAAVRRAVNNAKRALGTTAADPGTPIGPMNPPSN
jgi:hypothetical protein